MKRKYKRPTRLTREKYLVDDEFERLLHAAQGSPRDHALLAVTGYCALRPVELVGLLHGDVRLDGANSYILVKTAKQKEERDKDEAWLAPTATAALARYLRSLPKTRTAPGERLFPVTTRHAGRIFKRYAALAGLNQKYSIYALRHYRGTSVYAETKDLLAAKGALRHASLSSTEIYTHTVNLGPRLAAIDPLWRRKKGDGKGDAGV